MKQRELSHIGPRQVGVMPFTSDDVESSWGALRDVGINVRREHVRQMMQFLSPAMDAADVTPSPLPGLTPGSIAVPVQFLQTWLPGFVRTVTQVRVIDELVGITTQGAWEDEEAVQGMLEPLGTAEPYSDFGNVPFSSWNATYERRSIVRFEKGMQVGRLEELRSARVRIDSAAEKRAAAALALDIQRNNVGFFGYNDGTNRTYGILNDPSLPAAIPVPNGAGGSPLWSNKTFLEITADIRLGLKTLRIQSGGTIDPKKASITMGVPYDVVDYLSTTSEFGNSVQDWINSNYPNLRVVSAPQFVGAVGGQNVIYFYPESVDDGASDDSRVWVQVVPSKFETLGVEKRSKSYIEDYSNASAGVMLKRPYAVVRLVGM